MKRKEVSCFFAFFTTLCVVSFSQDNFSTTLVDYGSSLSGYLYSGEALPFGLDDGQTISRDDDIAFSADFGFQFFRRVLNDTSTLTLDAEVEQFLNEDRLLFRVSSASMGFRGLGMKAAVGKYRFSEGLNFADLSSGSLILSGIGPAYPVFYLATDDFLDLPYTNGMLQARASASFGTLDDDRTVESPLIHTKAFYGRLQLPAGLSITGGLVHAVLWGGNSLSYGQLPESVDDFWRALFAYSGGDDAPDGEVQNKLGNHLGMWDTSIGYKTEKFAIDLYYQHFFEDGSGREFRNGGWIDGLFGLGLTIKRQKFISALLYEYYNSTYQSGDGSHLESGGRDNYYQHYIYVDGWTYEGIPIGTPYVLLSGDEIHTRVRSHRLAATGNLTESVSFKIILDLSRYYGTYADMDSDSQNRRRIFYDGLPQNSASLMLRYSEPFSVKDMYTLLGFAYDKGDARGDSFGIRVSIGYTGRFIGR